MSSTPRKSEAEFPLEKHEGGLVGLCRGGEEDGEIYPDQDDVQDDADDQELSEGVNEGPIRLLLSGE